MTQRLTASMIDAIRAAPENIRRSDMQRLFSVSDRTLTNWIERGRLPHPNRVGGQIFWRRTDVCDWAESLPSAGVETRLGRTAAETR